MPNFDVCVIGAGPGGYVAAIKAAQHGKRVVVIEKEALGGICLNWGCIPTKALIKSADVLLECAHAETFGITVGKPKADFPAIVKRSRGVADSMAKGIDYLLRKNGVNVLMGTAKLISNRHVQVELNEGGTEFVEAEAIVIAGGVQARTFPNLPIDNDRVFQYRRAMALPEQPKSLLCIGAGAIGMEFTYFYSAIGTKVTVVEVADQVLPLEDVEVAKVVAKAFTKSGVDIRTATKVQSIVVGKHGVTATLEAVADGKTSTIEVDRVLVAVGMQAVTDTLGLKDAGVATDERGFIRVDEFMCTTAPGVYAIGDIAGKQLLAHKASYEAEVAVAHIVGHAVPADYTRVPACTYCQPQVASIGLTEAKAKAAGKQVTVGRFTFQASGKAKAVGAPEGFVKLIFEGEHLQLIGAHLVGHDVTELLGELAIALRLETTARELATTIHAHPTMAEAVMEAAADALGECVHQ